MRLYCSYHRPEGIALPAPEPKAQVSLPSRTGVLAARTVSKSLGWIQA